MTENKHRDHRELGQLLDLFSFHDVAPGDVFWHHNGMMIFRVLQNIARKINDTHGYQEIMTPQLVKTDLFKKSGHFDLYNDKMFYFTNPADEKEQLAIKPMNCPESTYVYNSTIKSYRDLPVRLAELTPLHRNELSGTLGGLLRVRKLTVDDAHIYCRPDQVEGEIISLIKILEKFYGLFDIKPSYVIATRPEKFLGEKENWDLAEKALQNAVTKENLSFETQKGEGAFYGPKIEVHLRDSQNRDWQMGTIQLDLVMLPEQFDVHYIDESGAQKKPWVIHRAIYGSFERFIGMILEHFDGQLPIWLSPIQVSINTVSEKHINYAENIKRDLDKAAVRSKINSENLTIGKKIREAEIKRIPLIIVVGDQEIENKSISLRKLNNKQLILLSLSEFLKNEINQTHLPNL